MKWKEPMNPLLPTVSFILSSIAGACILSGIGFLYL